MGLFPWSNFSTNQLTKFLGPSSLGVHQAWTKRNDHAPKNECVVCVCVFICNICPKREVLVRKNINQVWSFFCLLLSLSSLPQASIEFLFITTFLCRGPLLFLLEHLFCLSHRKTRWTMLVDNVGLKLCLLGTLNSMIILTFSPWCNLKWSRDVFNDQLEIVHGLGMTSWSMV